MSIPQGETEATLADTPSPVLFEIPPFAARCKKRAASIWSASFEHPFLKALIDGSLDLDRFRFYQMQDARYLEAYADACSLISVRCVLPGRKLWFIDAARLAIVVERELHTEYGKSLGYGPEAIASLELTPNNRAYGNHLLSACRSGTLLEAIAALAPCPWLYAEIGERVHPLLDRLDDGHPYRNWLETYADPAFVTYTNELLDHFERAARAHPDEEQRAAAEEAFLLSARYEWMFWDQAWTRQEWPDGEHE